MLCLGLPARCSCFPEAKTRAVLTLQRPPPPVPDDKKYIWPVDGAADFMVPWVWLHHPKGK